ncbi:MAG: MBL fold metallo-hydrolase [Endomicrobiaceae bacterium]
MLLFLITPAYSDISVEYFGGAGRVSGSCALLRIDNVSVIVDCGTFYQEDELPVDNNLLDDKLIKAKALVLTHSHIDHSGRIPYLISKGFNGVIYCTPATKKIILELYDDGWNFDDVMQRYFWSASKFSNIRNIQKGAVTLHWYEQCKRTIKNISYVDKKTSISFLKNKYKSNFKLCKKCLKRYLNEISSRFKEVRYGGNIKISENINFVLFDAGHIAGSSSIFFNVDSNGKKRRIAFSGDLGSGYSKILKSKEIIPKADDVFVESTYGGSVGNVTFKDYDRFQKEVAKAVKNKNIVWIPALALHRTQKILYEIKQAQDQGIIPLDVKIFSLSPSANGITDLYEHEIIYPSAQRWFSDEVYEKKTLLPRNYTTKKPKQFPKPSIVISSSGMMDQGTSLYLINKLLPFKDTSVFLVSYVSPHTPAGYLKKGAKYVKTKYGTTKVMAGVQSFSIFSDHPGIKERIRWLSKQDNNTNVYLVHGDRKNLKEAKTFLEKAGFNRVKIALNGENIIN